MPVSSSSQYPDGGKIESTGESTPSSSAVEIQKETSKTRCPLPPRIALILPPCVPLDKKAVVLVHVEWVAQSSADIEFELIGAAQGVQVFSRKFTKADAKVLRVEWVPATLGVVDVFVLGRNSDCQVSVGELGHLLVLPGIVCKEGNAMFSKLVACAGLNQQETSLSMSIQLERAIVVLLQNWDTTAQQCFENSTAPEIRLRSFPGLRRVDEFVRNAISSRSTLLPADKAGENLNVEKSCARLGQPDENSALHLQKNVWRSDFRTVVLDLDVLFQLLDARRIRMSQQQRQPVAAGRPGDLDIAIKLILGNLLRHLRKFEAWDFVAHVLQRCADFDVEVFWGDNPLQEETLTGARLQELARKKDEHRDVSRESDRMGTKDRLTF